LSESRVFSAPHQKSTQTTETEKQLKTNEVYRQMDFSFFHTTMIFSFLGNVRKPMEMETEKRRKMVDRSTKPKGIGNSFKASQKISKTNCSLIALKLLTL
jgi:hypothetical protein